MTEPSVVAVARDGRHRFSKLVQHEITLVAGLGVEGDAHFGETVQHRYDKRRTPNAPNNKQVHLMHAELFSEIAADGFDVAPGDLGENVTTAGVDLLHLPLRTRLHLGESAVIELTGLRSPCTKIDALGAGLMKRLIRRHDDGSVERLAGVMAIIVASGTVAPGDGILIELPSEPFEPLEPV